MLGGDLVEESDPPFIGDDSWPLEWPLTLDLVLGLMTDATVVVPGHGKVVDKDFVQDQRTELGVIAETIRDLASRGRAAVRGARRRASGRGSASGSRAPSGWATSTCPAARSGSPSSESPDRPTPPGAGLAVVGPVGLVHDREQRVPDRQHGVDRHAQGGQRHQPADSDHSGGTTSPDDATLGGISDDQLPEDLQPGEDNPLAEPLDPDDENTKSREELEMDATQEDLGNDDGAEPGARPSRATPTAPRPTPTSSEQRRRCRGQRHRRGLSRRQLPGSPPAVRRPGVTATHGVPPARRAGLGA